VPNRLPIHDALPELELALQQHKAGVLIAPPGAGKTTAVAPALLDQDWCTGQIILTSPRRVAARAAAERMAELLGERPGETIGYQTRLDSRVSARTRVLVVTEAIFVNRIVDDPDLEGVAAVLFDEAHERHLDTDLGLALALETQSVLREDLRVLVMSATLDGSRFATLLGSDAPIIESKGQSFPLDIKWLGGNPSVRLEERMANAVLSAWRESSGDILAFLPGVGEIERTHEKLEVSLKGVPILPLHGQVEPAAQRAAIRRDETGRRRIVLATAIAETSLTLDGVSVVVDSGLARFAEFDKAVGTSSLVTRAASQASATQRAGRAARQAPGTAYRLWEEGGHLGRPEFAAPEIATADLAPLVLKLAKWGSADPAELAWLDPPSDASISAARKTLVDMGALDENFRLTEQGKKIASLPLDPVGAATVLAGAKAADAMAAAELVMLLQERGLGGRGEDLLQRRDRWRNESGKRAGSARSLAEQWARAAQRLVEHDLRPANSPALYLALARPEMLARRRHSSGEHWLSVGGRGYVMDPASPLTRAEWIVIGDAQGQAKGARITAAAEVQPEIIESHLAQLIENRSTLTWNNDKGRAEARLERRIGAIRLSNSPDPAPDPLLLLDLLTTKALEKLEKLLPPGLLARGRFAGVDELAPARLRDSAEIWLAPLLDNRRDLDLPQSKLADAVLGQLEWGERQRLDKQAPTHFLSAAGTRHAIDYTGDDAPSVEVRVQALFGLDRHPMIGSTPLLLKLTSPAGRPIQSTRDLVGFWRGSWADVVKDMKGRYPKHRWPDQPWREKPSLKTKNAFNRG